MELPYNERTMLLPNTVGYQLKMLLPGMVYVFLSYLLLSSPRPQSKHYHLLSMCIFKQQSLFRGRALSPLGAGYQHFLSSFSVARPGSCALSFLPILLFIFLFVELQSGSPEQCLQCPKGYIFNVLVRVSFAVTKHHNQKAIWEERVSLAYVASIIFH